ncbi:MAG: hypothetical protein HZC17_04130 [Candidatus Omnitrophica bacterium]|nr:hypothetical protein [Candidatus Omnitrophota bacterium]
MNLVQFNFQTSPVISKLFRFESIIYRGELKPKIQHFETVREGETFHLITTTLIRKEESLVWKSCLDMLEFTMKTAAAGMQGLFGFDLLAIDFGKGIDHFNWNDLAALIVNRSRKLAVGEEVLIQYGSLFGMLKKRVSETWGKIDFHTAVEVFGKDSAQFDLVIKKLINDSAELTGAKIIAVLDLSQDPIFKFGLEEQTERLAKLLASQASQVMDIYVIHRDKAVELKAQFGVD